MTYNSWPIGKLPKALQRREPEMIKALGYNWTDAREIVTMFEDKVAEFAGCKYAVAVDCCTHAVELSLRYQRSHGMLVQSDVFAIPNNTYVSIYFLLRQLGFKVHLDENHRWAGFYFLTCNHGIPVADAAVRWQKDMFIPGTFYCLSFQIKKRIPIGRGGMVLTDNKEAADWIRLASYDGRDLSLPYDHPDHIKMEGYHYYMTPEDAARGLLLMDAVKEEGDSGNWTNYPDIKKMLKL